MFRLSAVARLSLLVLVGVGLLLVGCAKKQPAEGIKFEPKGGIAAKAPTGEPYKIGAVFAVSGPASPLGMPEKQTAEMLQKQINAEGGINGRPLEIIVMDTASEEDKCRMATERLIQNDKVLAIVGPSQSGETMAIIDTVQAAQVPLLSCAAAVKITEPVKKWVFKTPQTDAMAVERIFRVLQKRGTKKIAAITVANAFGEGGLEQMKKQAPNSGIQIVAEEKFGPKDTDMTTQLTRIKGTKAEAVVCWGTNPGPAVIAQNMQQLGMKIPLFQSHGVANEAFIKLAGKAAEGIMFPAGKLLVADSLADTDPQKKVLLAYKEAFQKEFNNKSPDTFGGHAWDAIMLVVNALRKSGPDRAKLRDELETTKGFRGIGGVFNLSPTDHNGLRPDAFVMVKIQNGRWVLAEEQ